MKEDEAKTKFCPLLIVGFYAGAVSGGDANTLCAASNCMMWQWEIINYISDPMRPSNTEPKISTAEGYCGLTK